MFGSFNMMLLLSHFTPKTYKLPDNNSEQSCTDKQLFKCTPREILQKLSKTCDNTYFEDRTHSVVLIFQLDGQPTDL